MSVALYIFTAGDSMHEEWEIGVQSLEARLGIEFRNRMLLMSALTHRSYLNEHREVTWEHYERLEFLGDAVLELCVTEYIFRRLTKHTEGELTAIRTALVSGSTLAKAGERLEVAHLILLSRGENANFALHHKVRAYIIACVLEAIIGAVHEDQGIGSSRFLVDSILLSSFTQWLESIKDSKSILQEISQDRFGKTPHYKLLFETGPDHDRHFTIAVFIGDKSAGIGEGTSKKEAEFAAGEDALRKLGYSSWKKYVIEKGEPGDSNPRQSKRGARRVYDRRTKPTASQT